ncbi:MAG: pirin family protein [Dehalococcoidia bacterium]
MAQTLTQAIDIRRATERFETRIDWLEAYHSFSFSRHYDPNNTHFGLLLVSNHDVIAPDTGFSTHPHRDMEIVTWVLRGELEHKDSEGNVGLIYPGLAQKMSAGTGILHSEINATKAAPVELVQMWVVPDAAKIRPGYQQLDINSELAKGGLVPLASGRGHESAIAIKQEGATLWVGRLKPGEAIAVPDSPFNHVYVADGEVKLSTGESLLKGDAARVTLGSGLRATAGPAGAELLIWEMDGTIRFN